MSATIDAPMVPGHAVRIKEIRVVPYTDQPEAKTPRRWFRAVVDNEWGIVQSGGLLMEGSLLCTRHHGTDCECREALRNSGLLESESPFAERA